MTSSWQSDAGAIECRWTSAGQQVNYNPIWMQQASAAQSSYLEPIPDFAAHSPFGGPSWFLESARTSTLR